MSQKLGLDLALASPEITKAAMERAIASLAGAKATDVKVDITVPEAKMAKTSPSTAQAMLSELQRTAKGNAPRPGHGGLSS